MGKDFRHQAACVGEDPELFFPVATTGPVYERQRAEALAVCARCPVQLECLSWAVDTGQRAGIWGGMDEVSRQQLHDLARLARRSRVATG